MKEKYTEEVRRYTEAARHVRRIRKGAAMIGSVVFATLGIYLVTQDNDAWGVFCVWWSAIIYANASTIRI